MSTDDEAIAFAAMSAGAEIVKRPHSLATGTATSESALVHALAVADPGERSQIVVFVQCTSPFIDPSDLDRAILQLESDESIGCVFSGVESHGFVWRRGERGMLGVNHDGAQRRRRQDLDADVVETGAFYVMRRTDFVLSGTRFCGKVESQIVPPLHRFEIDDAEDLQLCRALAAEVDPIGSYRLGHLAIDALVTDFDGVHTDNTALVDEHGFESVRVHRGDGLGLAMLRSHNIAVMILSKERNPVVERRATKRGVECRSGIDDKAHELTSWSEGRGISLDRIAYVGNDVNDRECLELVGHPVIVADAHPSLRDIPGVVVTERRGGDGAIREVIDALLAGSDSDCGLDRSDLELLGMSTP